MNKQQFEKYQNIKRYIERLLAQHLRTVWEVKTKCQQKKFEDEIVKKVMQEFLDAGFLDDRKYAKLWLENQIKYRPCGRILCYKKMLARGLGNSLIKEILEKEYSQEKEEAAARELADKKIKFYRALKGKKMRQKIVSFLKSRGFGDGVVIKVLEKLNLSLAWE
ncbi:MAG: RecX family transcriptional regulator [Patescibacteria group bacterium]